MRHTWREWSLITAAVKRRGHLSSGNRSLSHACMLVSSWDKEGSIEGFPCKPHPWYGRQGQDAGPTSPVERRGPRGRRSRWRSHRPSRPGPQMGACAAARLRPLPGPFLPEHCPSFTNPAARRRYQIPCLFRTFFPFGHFILLFLLNKNLSEAWRHAHCVCRLLFPPLYLYIYIWW